MASVNDRCGRAGSDRVQRAADQEADGRGDDGQGAVDQHWRQDAARNTVFSHRQRDGAEGQGSPYPTLHGAALLDLPEP